MLRHFKYWFGYYGGFLLILLYQLLFDPVNPISTSRPDKSNLADILTISALGAFALTIILEVIIAMVLIVPHVYDSIKAKGEAIGAARTEARFKQAAREWLTRKEAAEKAGVPFTEPPPWET